MLTVLIFVWADKEQWLNFLNLITPPANLEGKVSESIHRLISCSRCALPHLCQLQEFKQKSKTHPPWDAAALGFTALQSFWFCVILLRKSQSFKALAAAWLCWICKVFCLFIPSRLERRWYFSSAAFGYISLSDLGWLSKNHVFLGCCDFWARRSLTQAYVGTSSASINVHLLQNLPLTFKVKCRIVCSCFLKPLSNIWLLEL